MTNIITKLKELKEKTGWAGKIVTARSTNWSEDYSELGGKINMGKEIIKIRKAAVNLAEKEGGFYPKFRVKRNDGSSKKGGKHHKCDYFVIDLVHDKYAVPALQAYRKACRKEYPQLAKDLTQVIKIISEMEVE